jgi:hypothetical protein
MTDHETDRLVLAAVVAADSELIVTFDLDDFPTEACEPVGVEASHPDEFLLDLHDLSPDAFAPRSDDKPPTSTRPGNSTRTHNCRSSPIRGRGPGRGLRSMPVPMFEAR